jgi:hypothetical protein
MRNALVMTLLALGVIASIINAGATIYLRMHWNTLTEVNFLMLFVVVSISGMVVIISFFGALSCWCLLPEDND